MGSFAIPLSGLNAAQSQLQSVSNNLANSSTIGYKDSNLTFSALFSTASAFNGSGDALQTGSGVKTASTDINFTQGDQNTTGTSSNMDIQGTGFFLTRDSSGKVSYTRAGDFSPNNAGQLTSPNGGLVLGYPAVAGVTDTSGTLGPIDVGTVSSVAVPTKSFQFIANLDATTTAGATPFTTPIAVVDSLGATHNLTVSYSKTATGSWDYTVSLPNSDLSTGGAGSTTVASGTLNFDSSGNLVLAGTPPATSIPITISPTGTPAATFADGAAALTMQWKLTDSSGNPTITQNASGTGSAASSKTQDGFGSGTLSGYAVLADGTVQGTFTSGQTKSLGQVAIANFANNEGLVSTGDGNYDATFASGQATIGTAGSGGRGTIIGGATELSNVNIATEFASLIVAQQAYSANAKSVTTFQQVSQATLAMIQ